MDTEEKKTSENMEEAVRKAVEKAHEQAASEGRDTSCGCGEDAPKTAGESVSCTDNGGETGAEAEAQGAAEAEDAGGEGGAPENEAEEGKEPEKMDIFGRRSKKELEKKEEQIKSLNDQYIRLMAEFDNFRKRTEKEKSGMYAMGAKDVIEKILPVLDNFERGLALVGEQDKEDPFAAGMEKIYKQFVTVLTDLGVTPIDAAGKEFDPNLHNAVMHVDDDSFGENIVAEELQKGYLYKDSVVRHSMVKVAN